MSSQARTYRVILEVDIFVEVEEDEEWDHIEAELEAALSWDVYSDNYEGADVTYAEIDSYVEE